MRRSTARGRMLPQSLSTDPRYGRLSLKAQVLYPLMWVNSDDQGRISGDPDEIKYAACPNVDHISKPDIPELLKELGEVGLIKVYSTSSTMATQMLDWWFEQKLQWAWPSRFPPAPDWLDRLRYKKSAHEVITENWGSPETSPERSPETQAPLPLTTPLEDNKEKNTKEKRGRGISPESSGEKPSPSLTDLPLQEYLTETFPQAFGRKPNSREVAQLRDLGEEISSAGGATAEQVYDAFKEACGQNKLSVSYVRAIILDWLGVPRAPP